MLAPVRLPTSYFLSLFMKCQGVRYTLLDLDAHGPANNADHVSHRAATQDILAEKEVGQPFHVSSSSSLVFGVRLSASS